MTVSLPLFPLNSVLYPGLVLPLNVFEDRYRRLVADLEAQPEDVPRRFGVVAIRDGSEAAPVASSGNEAAGAAAGFGKDLTRSLYPVGCVAEIASVQTLGDGSSELISSGTTRFRVLAIDATGPYLTAEVEELPEQRGDGAGALAAGVARAFRTYQQRLAGARESTLTALQELPDDPSVLSYLVAAATVADTAVKQRLLEAPDTAARLSAELELLRREIAVLRELPSLPAVELTRKAPSPN
ncbi:LON peptidase substrate-binding domain-containing protein [Wenjunlia tyrosinilytica]|uniref:LON peptidase substrate-binding domain-containing protein n=1 Tax=Wenjunlia tyrosinilytica TaxID=1544741 RepID=UPI00166B5086|nr:LON peptidase substrate-binding domain-containing protein [Wenjunlia tyrosinilytica]